MRPRRTPWAMSVDETLVMPSIRDVVEAGAAVEGDRAEDRHLGGRVLAAHVLGGVGLGVAETLGLLEHVVVVGPGLGHLAQHVVGGAVDDAEHRLDLGRHQRLAQHLDDGHGADGAGLEAEVHAALLRRGEELGAVLRQQLLVGGHHVLAGLEGAELEVERRARPPDELHDHGDLRVLEDVLEARRDDSRVELGVAEARVLLEHPLEHDLLAGRQRDVLGVLLEQLAHAGPHGAVPEEPDPYLVHCLPSAVVRSSRGRAGAADAARRPRSLAR